MKNHNFVALVLLLVIATAVSLVVGLVKLGIAIAAKSPAPTPSPAMVYAPIFEEPAKVEELLADPWVKPVKVSAKKTKVRSLTELIREEAS